MERIVVCIFVKNVSILNIFGDSQKKGKSWKCLKGIDMLVVRIFD